MAAAIVYFLAYLHWIVFRKNLDVYGMNETWILRHAYDKFFMFIQVFDIFMYHCDAWQSKLHT